MKKEPKWSRRGERICIPNIPCILPPGTKGPLLHGILLRAKLEELQYQLANLEKETPNIVSFEKELQRGNTITYNSSGYRNDNNRNQIRARDFLFKERRNLIGSIDNVFPAFRIPASLRIAFTKCTRKFYLSSPNMIGFIIGPRGESLRALETEFQVRISIRGQGSTLNAKHEYSYPKNNEEEPLHALIEGDTEGKIDECVKRLEVLCKPVPDSENEIKKQQLRHLAMLNGVVSAESAFSDDFGKKSNKPPWYDDMMNLSESSELDEVVRELSMMTQGGGHLQTEIDDKNNQEHRFQINLMERDISALVPEPKVPGI